MPRALVTGATGFVGWHVAKQLRERGWEVRALSRSSKIPELDVETVRGDLRDAASLTAAAAGCERVFHVAADYRLWTANPAEMYASNVEGTRNLIAASKNAERIVYCSTVGAVGMRKNLIADEASPVSVDDMKGHYKRSKFLAEQVVMEAGRKGVPIVIVNPTTPIGDHDFKPTPTGKVIVDFLAGRIPAYIDTGLNYVDVQDVAAGHLLAAERGRVGERYILGSENLTLKQMLDRLAIPAGKPAPIVQVPYALAYAAAFCSTTWSRITGQHPGIPLDGVRYAHIKMWVSHQKAATELGYAPKPVDDALRRAVEWVRHG
ncbi:hopanoid-associated sugar epimerase [Bryobacter aggregatus]|uniref:hopanoid-associated sugar epimerase n=1 Tax=Bryobacter aggregatus TaxID=360054 RepID=UPI0004E2130C|nr:hopanoid-associated sugar epimerase [Bryobacter aggregatus]